MNPKSQDGSAKQVENLKTIFQTVHLLENLEKKKKVSKYEQKKITFTHRLNTPIQLDTNLKEKTETLKVLPQPNN